MNNECKKRILLVEDDVLIALNEKLQLEKHDYTVNHVTNGEDAIKTVLAPEPHFDLILMDIDLGKGMDGTETANHILKKMDIPVVFLSSHTEPEIVKKTEKITSYGYVVKNTGVIVLDAAVKMALKLFEEKIDRRQAELKLKESEERYRELVDTINSGVAIYKVINDGCSGSDYIIKDFNQFALKHEMLKKEEVVGKSLKDIRPNIDDYGLIDTFREVWKTGIPAYFPAKIYVDNKYSNYYENRIFKLPSGEVVAIYDDVTMKMRAEKSLKESEERFEHAMDATDDGIFDWDLKTNAIYYSPGWKKMLGYENHELPNDFSVWETTTDPKDVEKSWELQQKLISKQIDRFVIEFKMKHKHGHWVDILSRAKAIFDDKGEAIRIVGTHTDISERKKAEKEIKKQLKEKYH